MRSRLAACALPSPPLLLLLYSGLSLSPLHQPITSYLFVYFIYRLSYLPVSSYTAFYLLILLSVLKANVSSGQVRFTLRLLAAARSAGYSASA